MPCCRVTVRVRDVSVLFGKRATLTSDSELEMFLKSGFCRNFGA